MSPADVRRRLLAGGYIPVPCVGKRPVLEAWQKILEPTLAEIEFWTRTAPAATNTGVLTRTTPTLDIDIVDPEAAKAVEALARERFEERGQVLLRFGRAPKRCIPFRTDTPFPKIKRVFGDPDTPEGDCEKLELLCDGQQVIVDGVHPDTGRPYSWHDGSPVEVERQDLPYIHEEEARALIDAAAKLLVEKFKYRLRPTKRPKDGNGADEPPTDWSFTPDDLTDHDRLTAFAMKLVKSGMGAGAAVNFLRGAVAGLANVDEERRQRRLKEIPRMVASAEEKLAAAQARDTRGAKAAESGPRPDYVPPGEGEDDAPVAFKTLAAFVKEYVPLDYTVDPIIRGGSLYTLTAKTGAGKTALMVVMALAVATGRRDLLNLEVATGRVAYLTAENPDDARMRFMIACYLLNINFDEIADRIVILDRRARPENIVAALTRLAEQKPFS